MSDHPEPTATDLADGLRAACEEIEHLQRALKTRHGIGVAQGMLMVRYGISMHTAFEYLSRRSQDENIKLHELAGEVVAELGAAGDHPPSAAVAPGP